MQGGTVTSLFAVSAACRLFCCLSAENTGHTCSVCDILDKAARDILQQESKHRNNKFAPDTIYCKPLRKWYNC
jgi:hypothetical protein